MKSTLRNIFVLCCCAIAAAAIFSSCKSPNSPSSDAGCGIATITDRLWHSPTWGNFKPDTYTLASERYYNFFIVIDSICPNKHINMDASALFDGASKRIQFKDAVEWSFFFEQTDTGKTEATPGQLQDSAWDGKVYGVGLKAAFGETQARVSANVYVHFPTLGSQEQDSVFLAKHVKQIYVSVKYDYFKPKQ